MQFSMTLNECALPSPRWGEGARKADEGDSLGQIKS